MADCMFQYLLNFCSVRSEYLRIKPLKAEKCLRLLYNLIKITKNNIFDILFELFNRAVY